MKYLSLIAVLGSLALAPPASAQALSVPKATQADRSAVQGALRLPVRDVRIRCASAGRHSVRCHDGAYAVWLEGYPPSWATWTDVLLVRHGALLIKPGPATI